MTELPTREHIRMGYSTHDEHLDIAAAYGAGVLLTRAEWEATIDYEAATAEVGKLVYVQLNDIGYLEAGRRIVNAAVGEETP